MSMLLLECILFIVLRMALANNWPIIGIFTEPSHSTKGNCRGDCVSLPASYVKFIEGAGGRVIPINFYASQNEIDFFLKNVNGFLFPGGAAALPPSGQYLVDKIIWENDHDNFIPLWGTCLGLEWLLMTISRNLSILDPPSSHFMNANNISLPLTFQVNPQQTKLFSNLPKSLYLSAQKENITMNNHRYGIYPSHFQATGSLTSFFRVISTSRDRDQMEFISTVEAYKYPIFGTQWHPEKAIYEWTKTMDGIPLEAIPHSLPAIQLSQYVANFFVQECRKNNHKFNNYTVENNLLIDNYVVTKTTGGSFSQMYYMHF